MVRRDMNHASVFFFSIGNEIPQGLSAQGVREAAEISVRKKRPFAPVFQLINFPRQARDKRCVGKSRRFRRHSSERLIRSDGR